MTIIDTISNPAGQPTREIVFVESNVRDYQSLLEGVAPGVEVHVLDAAQDGLAQIANILGGRSGIDAIHIVSHGSEGALQLGALTLTAGNLQDHAGNLATIGSALDTNADILLYGCDVAAGSAGAALIEALAQATQADIAASTNLTGAETKGGDWQLEYVQGLIETASPLSAMAKDAFQGNLGVGDNDTFDMTAVSGYGTKVVTSVGTHGTLKVESTVQNLLDSEGFTGNAGEISTDFGTGTDETSVKFSENTGKTFDFGSITITNYDELETLVLTTSKGGTLSLDCATSATITFSHPGSNALFDGISWFTITENTAGESLGDNGYALTFDNVVLNNITAPAPTVSSVTSSTANGSYNAGDVIGIQVTFSEAVTVTGTPQLTLETGTTDQVVNYASGTGTTALTFTYTVQAGDTSADLDYITTNPLALNSGTINATTGGAAATLTLASPGAANSLGANKAIVIDTSAPSAPSAPDMTAGTDSATNTDNITSDTTPDFTGTAEAGSTVTLYDTDGTASLGSTTATGGAWTITASTLTEGAHTVTAKATDSAGNVGSASSGLSVTIDTSAPSAPGTPDMTAGTDSGTSDSDNTTSDTTPTFTGTAEANATVTLISSVNGTVGTASADGSGNWSITASALNADAHTITATATDTAGNVSSASSGLSVSIDTSAPAITFSALSFSADTGSSSTDFITQTAAQTIGATLSGAPVGADIVYGSLDNGGTWTDITSKVSGTTLTWIGVTLSASSTLKLKVTDSAGNDGTVASQAYTLDTSAPSISAVGIPNATMKVGDSVTATITVADDGGSAYTLGSGSIGGFTLGSLARTNSTTYTASFTVTEGGTDVAAGSGIPLSVVLTDNAGNGNSAYTTAIAQAGDAINAHTPTDIALSNNSVATIGGANAVVGALSSTDGSSGDAFTYTLVAGSGDTNNASFNISGGNLRVTDPSAMSGSYSVRVRSTDAGGNWYEEAQSITVSANAAPTLTTVDSVTGGTEDTEKEITFGALQGLANEADSDGTVTAFIVKAVSTGTLKIGADAGSATAWHATTNKTIDNTHVAYWTPAANANGDLNAFTVVALDNQTVESAAPVQVVVTAAAVNDAPTLSGNASLTAINEDVVSANAEAIGSYPNYGDGLDSLLTASGYADAADSDGRMGIVITNDASNPVTEGRWQYFCAADATYEYWHDIGTVSASAGLVLEASGSTESFLRFVPVANFSGTPGGLTIHAIDNGTTGQTINYTTWNGTTETRVTFNTTADDATSRVSASGQTWSVTVTPIADTPAVTDANTTPATQTTSGLVLSRNAADGAEVTHFKITGIANGNLFKNDGTTAINNGTFITYAEGHAGLKFTPTGGGNGSFTAQAATSAADGGLGGSTVNAAIAVGAAVASTTIAEDSASTTIVISQGGAETHYKITAVTGGTLYSDAGLTTQITDGSFIASAGATTNVYFVPTANRNGTTGGNGSFTAQASASNVDGGLTGSQITSTVTLTPVADTPLVTDTTVPAGTQSTSGLVLSRNAADGTETTHFKITGITGGTLYKNDGTTAITNGTFITYAEGNAGLKFTPSGTDNGSFTAQAATSAADDGLGGSTVTAAAAVTVPAIASATYNSTTGVLAITGSGFLALAGATNDIVASKFTITGQGSGTYTLTDTANVEITSGTAFTLTLSTTDKAGVNALVNKAGTASTDNTVYNLAAAEDWAAGAASALNVADLTGNGITATLNQAPAIASNGGGATAAVSVAENATAVTTVTATDGDGDTPAFSISGGTDQAKFSINAGVLSFAAAPDFETPTDSDANNTYAVEVTASDGNGGSDIQTITITVTDVGEGGGGSTPATPTTTTTTPVTVDGATVSSTTVTTTTSSGTQTSTTETVAPVTETRQEDSSTEHRTLADVPLATDSSGETVLQVSLPLGIGLTSQTITGSGASTLRDLLIAASDPKVSDTTVFDAILAHGIDAYVPTVQDERQVTVRTITFTEAAALPGQSIIVTGAQGTGESNALHPLRQEALVVDTRNLPAGTVLTFDNVEFAIVVGAATLTGGNGRNFVIGDGASQHIVLGADDDELHGGAGNDYVGSKGGNDKLYGDEGDDTVSGGDGNDVLDGGTGVDFMHGGKDGDMATFAGVASRYQVTYDYGKTVVRSLDDANDVDTLVNVETLHFADRDVDVTPYATDFSWIATLYRQVLGRQAELDGFQFWAQVATAGESHGDIGLNFLRSSENGILFDTLDTTAQIECLYTELLGRPSELAGKEYWMLQHANGMSMTEIAWNFVHSVELTGQYLAPQGWDFTV